MNREDLGSKIVAFLSKVPWTDVTGGFTLDSEFIQTLATSTKDRVCVLSRYEDEDRPYFLFLRVGFDWKAITINQEILDGLWEQVCPQT